jgi:hypothetical protein
VLRARLFTTSGDFSKGLQYYDSLVNQYPDKHYIKEYAEVLLGKNQIEQASAVMDSNSALFGVNELESFRAKVNVSRRQKAGVTFSYFKDIGENSRIENALWWQQGMDRKYRFRVRAGISVNRSGFGEMTNTRFGELIVDERWGMKWSGKTELYLQNIQPKTSENFFTITGRQTVSYKPNDRRMLGLYYGSEILNYTASLLQMNIRSHNLGYVTHIMFSGKTGFFSEGSWGALNDGNRRLQFFGSAYYLFRTQPVVKAGVNFSALHYSNNDVIVYFSPNRFLSNELFAEYLGMLPWLSGLYMQLQVAAGMQQIERQPWEPAFRIQTEISYRKTNFDLGIRYQASNVASASGSGYKYNMLTLGFTWKW